jgi:glutamine cyclotransferase
MKKLKQLLCAAGLGFSFSLSAHQLDTLSQLSVKDFTDYQISEISYQVTDEVDMLSRSFVEGMASRDGVIYVSSGGFGYSYITAYTLDQSKSLYTHFLGSNAFGEGITFYHNHLYQMNYHSQAVDVYDYALQKNQTITFPIEGWGLTHNSHSFISTDGSNQVYFISPETHKITKSIKLFFPGTQRQISHLNDLTYVNGQLYINIFGTSLILVIDAQDGEIKGLLNLETLSKQQGNLPPNCTMNGITYVKDKNVFVIGGKCWKKRYVISINQQGDNK